jgi:putative heme transporter
VVADLSAQGWGGRRRVLVGCLSYLLALIAALALLRARGTDLHHALDLLRQASLPLLGLALAAEALRFGAMGLLLSTLAARLGVRASPFASTRLMLIAVAARHVLPLGGVPDYALRAQFLQRRGMRAATIAAYFLLDSALSWLALIVIFCAGFVGYLAFEWQLPPQPLLFGSAALATFLALALLVWLCRAPRLAARLAALLGSSLRRMPAWLGGRRVDALSWPARFAEDLKQSLHTARATGSAPRFVVAVALLPPLADIAALGAVFAALGQPVNPPAMLLGYGLAGYLAFLTPLPADAGVVEAALTLVFASLGYDLGIVVIGVLLFRLISFWLPIPVGLLAAWGHPQPVQRQPCSET